MQLLREAHRTGRLRLAPRELPWLDRMQQAAETLPDTELAFIGEMMGEVDTSRFRAADYGIGEAR